MLIGTQPEGNIGVVNIKEVWTHCSEDIEIHKLIKRLNTVEVGHDRSYVVAWSKIIRALEDVGTESVVAQGLEDLRIKVVEASRSQIVSKLNGINLIQLAFRIK